MHVLIRAYVKHIRTYIPEACGLLRSIEMGMDMNLKIIPPEKSLVNSHIEARPPPYRIEQRFSLVISLLVVPQVEETLAFSYHAVHQLVRHAVVYDLIIIKTLITTYSPQELIYVNHSVIY